jgi:hypothetical protein
MCFKNAKDKTGEALATAYQIETTAIGYRAAGMRKESVTAFTTASTKFLEAGRVEKAARCQQAIGDNLAAAGERDRRPAEF